MRNPCAICGLRSGKEAPRRISMDGCMDECFNRIGIDDEPLAPWFQGFGNLERYTEGFKQQYTMIYHSILVQSTINPDQCDMITSGKWIVRPHRCLLFAALLCSQNISIANWPGGKLTKPRRICQVSRPFLF